MVFCNILECSTINGAVVVTILILIDGFLQYSLFLKIYGDNHSHNPYFNRWFSAIKVVERLDNRSARSQSLF